MLTTYINNWLAAHPNWDDYGAYDGNLASVYHEKMDDLAWAWLRGYGIDAWTVWNGEAHNPRCNIDPEWDVDAKVVTYLSMPDPEGTTRIDMIRAKLHGDTEFLDNQLDLHTEMQKQDGPVEGVDSHAYYGPMTTLTNYEEAMRDREFD